MQRCPGARRIVPSTSTTRRPPNQRPRAEIPLSTTCSRFTPPGAPKRVRRDAACDARPAMLRPGDGHAATATGSLQRRRCGASRNFARPSGAAELTVLHDFGANRTRGSIVPRAEPDHDPNYGSTGGRRQSSSMKEALKAKFCRALPTKLDGWTRRCRVSGIEARKSPAPATIGNAPTGRQAADPRSTRRVQSARVQQNVRNATGQTKCDITPLHVRICRRPAGFGRRAAERSTVPLVLLHR